MRIRKENTMALIIDFQEKLMPVMNDKEELEKRTNILVRGLKILEIPMHITQQYTKGLGMSIPSVYESSEADNYFEKVTFSCYDNAEIRRMIDSSGCKNIIICGIEAHICVLQTCIDLQEAGYNPVLVTDCISSRKPADKEMALIRAQQEGILLTTSEAILFELTRTAGTDTFKQISRLIK